MALLINKCHYFAGEPNQASCCNKHKKRHSQYIPHAKNSCPFLSGRWMAGTAAVIPPELFTFAVTAAEMSENFTPQQLTNSKLLFVMNL
jgi:hypothetical protein